MPIAVREKMVTKKKIDGSTHEPLSAKTLCLLFSILFLPMLAIPLVLLLLVTVSKVNFLTNGSDELPTDDLMPVSPSYYYTQVSPGRYTVVSSWASTVGGHITAPFLMLFSFLIAWYISRSKEQQAVQGERARTQDTKQIRAMLHTRTFLKLWTWVKMIWPWSRHSAAANGAMRVAVFGLTLTLTFTSLILVGDNWLHFTVKSEIHRYFGQVEHPVPDPSVDPSNPNSPLFLYAAGYAPHADCDGFLNGSDPTPCSLVKTPFFNLKTPDDAYFVLQAGIGSTSVDFGNINLTEAIQKQNQDTASMNEVITYLDPRTNSNHSFLFSVDAAAQTPCGNDANCGYDFIAPSLSMQTSCEPIASACGIKSGSSLFNCSDIFSGNLSADSIDGRVRIPGWDTFYYTFGNNGSAHQLGLSEDQNPFRFNVTVQIDAISELLALTQNGDDPQDPNTVQLRDPLVNTGNGSVAFAMSCNTTVYEVDYSVVNATISNFQPRLADPKLAAIMRAPMQVGYGRYNLYQSAILSVIRWTRGDEALESALARTFSEVGVALSSGAFAYTTNRAQRYRFDMEVTAVPKAAVWFLAIVCLLYAFIGLLIFVGAMIVRKSDAVRSIEQKFRFENPNTILAQSYAAYRGAAYEEIQGSAEHWTGKGERGL